MKAVWSTDADLTTRIDPAVAHYTGQTKLADVIQQGLAAKAARGDRNAFGEIVLDDMERVEPVDRGRRVAGHEAGDRVLLPR